MTFDQFGESIEQSRACSCALQCHRRRARSALPIDTKTLGHRLVVTRALCRIARQVDAVRHGRRFYAVGVAHLARPHFAHAQHTIRVAPRTRLPRCKARVVEVIEMMHGAHKACYFTFRLQLGKRVAADAVLRVQHVEAAWIAGFHAGLERAKPRIDEMRRCSVVSLRSWRESRGTAARGRAFLRLRPARRALHRGLHQQAHSQVRAHAPRRRAD